jgi:hypothetical protein
LSPCAGCSGPERVDQERRRTLARAIFHWHQVRAVAHRGVAAGERRRLRVLRIVLAEDSAEELTERIVKRIEPDHRRIAKMTMVVPAPTRGKYEIARPHRHALALDSRVGAFALDNEAQRIGRMPVGGRDLAGLDHLHAAKERICNVSGTGQPGIFQHEHAPLGLLRRNELDRSHKMRAYVPVAPDCRQRSRARPHARRALPQRSCVKVPDTP